MTAHERLALAGAMLVSLGVIIGWLLGHWRAYAECCDCCTCVECEPELIVPKLGRGYSYQFDVYGNSYGEGDAVSPGRRTVVLEPGPTIYQSLAALADEALDGPVRHAEPITSTWLRTVLLDWERRFPIPLDSPSGNMAEAL